MERSRLQVLTKYLIYFNLKLFHSISTIFYKLVLLSHPRYISLAEVIKDARRYVSEK